MAHDMCLHVLMLIVSLDYMSISLYVDLDLGPLEILLAGSLGRRELQVIELLLLLPHGPDQARKGFVLVGHEKLFRKRPETRSVL